MKTPKFISCDVTAMPDPEWKGEQGKGGAQKASHPCIIVIAAIDEDHNLWVYDDKAGFRRLTP